MSRKVKRTKPSEYICVAIDPITRALYAATNKTFTTVPFRLKIGISATNDTTAIMTTLLIQSNCSISFSWLIADGTDMNMPSSAAKNTD